MARKKDTPQKAALREMMGNYLKENNVKVKDGTDVNSIMRDMNITVRRGSSAYFGIYTLGRYISFASNN